jgi:hypothetical protein
VSASKGFLSVALIR